MVVSDHGVGSYRWFFGCHGGWSSLRSDVGHRDCRRGGSGLVGGWC